ncbi:uncharacterized protein [Physcomitrium patens]|uniref:uncharacterized protein n=1 Tax=Physcomitrium patens TaxID=3218 RepID=UPI003CCD5278
MDVWLAADMEAYVGWNAVETILWNRTLAVWLCQASKQASESEFVSCVSSGREQQQQRLWRCWAVIEWLCLFLVLLLLRDGELGGFHANEKGLAMSIVIRDTCVCDIDVHVDSRADYVFVISTNGLG